MAKASNMAEPKVKTQEMTPGTPLSHGKGVGCTTGE